MQRTRIVSIDIEARRNAGENSCTVIPESRPGADSWPGFEVLFRRACADLRSISRRFAERFAQRGVVTLACHPRYGVTGRVCIAAKPGIINSAVVGRHDRADLLLSADPEVALRHLLVIAHSAGGPELLSVLDLRTGSGFLDEQGERREAVTCDGPLFLRCGEYALFILPIAIGRGLATGAADAWKELPPRRFLPASFGIPGAPRAVHPVGGLVAEPTANITSVSWRPAPRQLREDLVRPGESPFALLDIDGPRGKASLAVGKTALREGVFLGRYPRCDSADVFDGNVSRVHALVIEIDGSAYAIDCGSSNGLTANGEERRVVPLGSRVSLELGATRVEWRPVN